MPDKNDERRLSKQVPGCSEKNVRFPYWFDEKDHGYRDMVDSLQQT